MAIENIPVWSFEPNWSNNVTESLEWLTSILSSPTGAEQRRSLRLYPRRELEFSIAVPFDERAAAENFTQRHGGRNIYLPLWHEAYRLESNAIAGTAALHVKSANNGGIAVGDVVFIGDPTNPLLFEMAEVQAVTSTLVTLTAPLAGTWPRNAKLHPVRKARLLDQPSFRTTSDSMASATVAFNFMEVNDDADPYAALADQFDTFESVSVITAEPDFSMASERGIERMIEEYDNRLSLPIYRDTANRAFSTQVHHWINRGRAEYEAFRKLAYVLSGRFRVAWLPSFTADFRMVADTPAGQQYLQVGNIGYIANGGIASGRTRICIKKTDGTRIYRRITNATVTSSGDEVLGLDAAFPAGLTRESVLRISFMQLCRLDQDRLEIVHKTDTQGVSLCSATFRAAPNLREVRAGF